MPIRSSLARGWPLAVLGLAPIISIARVAVVGALVPVADFAIYSSVVASGTFLSTIVSFGQVEQTVKAFPRLVADGRAGALAYQTGRIAAILAGRALMLCALLYAAATLIAPEHRQFAAVTAGVALGAALFGLLASVQRAFANLGRLAAGTLLRVSLATSAVCLTALSRDLALILMAEAGAMLAAAVLTWIIFFRHLKPDPDQRVSRTAARAGLILFAAQMLAAVPFYLDRAFVTAILPGFAAGQYAVLALAILASALLAGTIEQRVAPETVIRVHRGETGLARQQIWRWIGVAAACWTLAMGVAMAMVKLGWVPVAYARYDITPDLLVPVWLIGLLINSNQIAMLALALDRERQLLRAALLFLVAVLAAAALIAWQGGTIVAVLWGLVAARSVYFTALWHASRDRAAPAAGSGSDAVLSAGSGAIAGRVDVGAGDLLAGGAGFAPAAVPSPARCADLAGPQQQSRRGERAE